VVRALANARAAILTEKPNRWRVTGPDFDNDELTVIVAIEDGLLVVTVFWQGGLIMNKCATCENGKMKKTMVEWTRIIDGTRFVGTMPGYVCDSCKEEHVDAIVLEKFEEQIALEIARRGRISSAAFRFMRTTICLSSKERPGPFGC
jgi:hypothetical protein